MTLVYLDTETTGLNPARHEVWEIAYAIDDGPILSSVVRHSLTNAHPVALSMNGYHGRTRVGYSPRTADAFEADLVGALKGATLVGANPAFDAAFLNARWLEAPWKYRLLDIEAYAMPAIDLDEPIGLQKIAAWLGVASGEVHTAAGDVHTLRECHRTLRHIYAEQVAS